MDQYGRPDDGSMAPPMTPPMQPMESEVGFDRLESRWPSVIGGISIALGILGLCCFALSMVNLVLTSALSGTAQAPPPQPAVLKIQQTLAFVFMIVLSTWHLIGGIGLVKRRTWARTALVSWAVVKSLTSLASTILSVLYAAETARMINDGMTAQSQGAAPAFQVTETMVLLFVYGSLVWFLIWPIFLLAWFSRRKIRDEVAQWGERAMV